MSDSDRLIPINYFHFFSLVHDSVNHGGKFRHSTCKTIHVQRTYIHTYLYNIHVFNTTCNLKSNLYLRFNLKLSAIRIPIGITIGIGIVEHVEVMERNVRDAALSGRASVNHWVMRRNCHATV